MQSNDYTYDFVQVTKAPTPHYIGASMAFIVGSVYSALTALLTRRVYQRDQSLFKVNICMARICTSTVMVTSLCTRKLPDYQDSNNLDPQRNSPEI